jgi:hypothetical protein
MCGLVEVMTNMTLSADHKHFSEEKTIPELIFLTDQLCPPLFFLPLHGERKRGKRNQLGHHEHHLDQRKINIT